MADSELTEILNRLLRGEISATETYDQAIEKVNDEPGAVDVRRIASEHRQAAGLLRQHVQRHGGSPEMDSGAWGTWAQTVMGTAKLFGDAAALKALKEGEEHGIKEYETALNDQTLPAECRELIQNHLLPSQHEHIRAIDGAMAVMSRSAN